MYCQYIPAVENGRIVSDISIETFQPGWCIDASVFRRVAKRILRQRWNS